MGSRGLMFLVVLGLTTGVYADGAASSDAAAETDSSVASGSVESSTVDQIHTWIYRGLQNWIDHFDTWSADSTRPLLPIPPSSLRVGFEGALFNTTVGIAFVGRPDVEGTLRLPNLERRLRLFITSEDVGESPADPVRQTSPIRIGARVLPGGQIAFDVGVHTSVHPSAFATLKWSPRLEYRWLTALPFAKAYAESNLGAGISSGVMLQRLQARWMVRSSTYGDWLRRISGASSATWSQTLIAGRVTGTAPEQQFGSIADGRDIACGVFFRLYVSGDNDSRASVYETSVSLRRQLYRGWLYAYGEPTLRWGRFDQWHPDVGVRIGVAAYFIPTSAVMC